MAFYARNSEKKVFHKVLIHQLKRLFDEEDETSVEDYLRAKLDRIKTSESTPEKEEIISLLLSFMNDVSATYDQFNKSLLHKSRSFAIRSGELNEANEKLSKNDRNINNSVVNLKVSLKDLIGKKNEDEIQFENYELEELSELIKTLIHKNKSNAKKLKRNNKKLKVQSEELALKNRNIMDGLEYAKQMQDTILTGSERLRSIFKDSFMLNLPKEIVSGDFLWVHKQASKIIIALADCTGHGVPGAFTSIISHMVLNDIVVNNNISYPSAILAQLHERITHIFRLDANRAHSHDGLDIAICTIDLENDRLLFSGAGRPMVLVRKNELKVLKGDPQSVGGIAIQKEKKYPTHELSLEEDDYLYLYSDGFADQFSGHDSTKFSTKKFQELLLQLSSNKSDTQADLLLQSHSNWKGQTKQVDDILVVGFRYQIH
ncbi:MAG: SpoIIE family protein phosphatase [Bacteroidetes bacterium]|nr:SpoIIE family protein phosphatase [Bacteroidota bacterium]